MFACRPVRCLLALRVLRSLPGNVLKLLECVLLGRLHEVW